MVLPPERRVFINMWLYVGDIDMSTQHHKIYLYWDILGLLLQTSPLLTLWTLFYLKEEST